MVHHKSRIVYATENPNIIIHVLKRTMLLTSNCVSVRCCLFAPLQRQHEECSIDTVTAGGLVQSFDNDSTEQQYYHDYSYYCGHDQYVEYVGDSKYDY